MAYVDAALTQASAPQAQAATVPDSSTATPAKSLASALETLAADLPNSIGNWLGQGTQAPALSGATAAGDRPGGTSLYPNASGDSAPGSSDGAGRLLALMRQDMSAFGSKVGDGDLSWRKAETSRPMDFFA